MGCSASCCRKKKNKNVIDPANNNTKLIQVKSQKNNNVLPLKKRYRYDVEEIQDILNGHTHSLSTQSKYSNGSTKAASLTRVSSTEEDLDRKISLINRSRSYSPGRESKASVSSSRKLSKNNNNQSSRELNGKNMKGSVSFEQNVISNDKVKSISEKDLEERNNFRNINKTPKKTPKKKLMKSKKKRNESLLSNKETNPMNPLDDKNILDTIKSYLDSVKQNNYNENREHSMQVKTVDVYTNKFLCIQESPSKQVIRIQSTRSSKLRAKSARQRLRTTQEYEELHIGPFY